MTTTTTAGATTFDVDATTTGVTAGDFTWLELETAAAVIGVSVRTLQRRVQRGELRARTTETGRREIELPRATRFDATGVTQLDTPHNATSGDAGTGDTATAGGDNVASGAVLAILAERAVNLAERRADELAEGLKIATIERQRAQRTTFWTMAAAGIVATVGTFWGIRAVDAANSRAAAADARASSLEYRATTDQQWRQFVDRLDEWTIAQDSVTIP